MMIKIYILVLICFSTITCAPKKNNNSPFIPEIPKIKNDDSVENKRKNADILRSNDKDMIEALNDPALTSVTREFGYSIIRKIELPFKSGVVKSDILPWSSWWYPQRDPALFDDSRTTSSKDFNNLSALSKFDLYKNAKTKSPSFAAANERRAYNPNALPWEGLCDAWSIAAISSLEPRNPVLIKIPSNSNKSILFDIKDLKGLLLKTYEAVDDKDFKYYGQKFTGQDKAWIYPDLFPEQFHRFLEVQLFEKHKAFIVDIDQGVEVWNVPVFKANYTMSEIPNKPNSVFVRTWIYFADSIKTNEHLFVGSKEVVREYDYVLEGEPNSNGELVVTLGYWVKGPNGNDSRLDHPDFIMVPPEPSQIIRKSWNPDIDNETVDEILSKSYE